MLNQELLRQRLNELEGLPKTYKPRPKSNWLPKEEYIRLQRLKRAREFVESKAGVQMAFDDPNLFKQLLREMEHPETRWSTTGRRL